MIKRLTEEEYATQSYVIRGYQTLGSRLLVNNDLIEIYKLISSTDSDTYYGNVCSKLEDVILHAKQFFNNHYRIHNVPFFSKKRVNELSSEASAILQDGDIEEMFDYIDKIEEEKQIVSPFELELEMGNYDSMFNGCLTIELMGIPRSDFLRDTFIAFSNIFIDSDIGDLSVPVYIHELTHSQIESVKGSCLNYQNCEVISIFNEKLAALELDPTGNLLKEIEKRRYKALSKNIHTLMFPEEHDAFEIFKSSYYISSTLKATHLFDKYQRGNQSIRKEIISGIQKVFDGVMTVEDLLDDNNITFENSCNVELTKRHI